MMEMNNIEDTANAPIIAIEIERVELNAKPTDKSKTLGCWGPSPDDNMNQC